MGCNQSKNQEPTTGELSQTTVPCEEIKALAEKFKADVEKELGKELDTFDAVSFRKQVVAANVYFIKVKVGDDYAHIRIYDPIPKASDKTASEKGEGSEESKGEDSEEKTETATETPGSSKEEEQKPTAKFEGVQKGKTLEDDIVEFQEPSPCEEVQAAVEEAPEPPKEEPEKEEPKEEPKEEEPKKEEPESKEEGGGLLDTVKAGASSVQEEGSSLLDTAKAGAASVGVSF
ncbi:protein TonB-like [Saccostrea cucullata]|uniref:protein TonB-like n=1 Tax=Saccostrea cuccullata TaxID=36930 RepID=UPI002ED3F996